MYTFTQTINLADSVTNKPLFHAFFNRSICMFGIKVREEEWITRCERNIDPEKERYAVWKTAVEYVRKYHPEDLPGEGSIWVTSCPDDLDTIVAMAVVEMISSGKKLENRDKKKIDLVVSYNHNQRSAIPKSQYQVVPVIRMTKNRSFSVEEKVRKVLRWFETGRVR